MQQKDVAPGLILRITCIGWLLAKLISYKVWLTGRAFPLVPPFHAWLAAPGWLHTALYIISLLLITAILLFPARSVWAVMLLVVELTSCALDQNRWQPWEYQYLFTLFLFTCLHERKKKDIIPLVALIISATYILSALNKFTPGFLASVWDALMLKGFFKLSASTIHKPFVYHSGYLLPVIELMAGLGLFFQRTQKKAAALAIAMHLFILLIFGITGIKHNTVIWPWNMTMILLILLLFIRSATFIPSIRAILSWPGASTVIGWIVLPALCFWGLWDNYLSANLYSGRQPYMLICIDHPELAPSLSTHLEQDNNAICNGAKMLNVSKWAYRQLNVPPYPQKRVFIEIKRSFLQQYPGAACKFMYYPHATWAGHRPQDIAEEL